MSTRNINNKGVAWLYSEVCALLDVWADDEIQQQLAGRLHNMCIYEKISKRLLDLGIDRTGEQCREKIKKLKRDYKVVIDNNYSPAFARKLLGCYDKVHEIFGKCSVVKPSFVIESFVYNADEKLQINNSEENELSFSRFQSVIEKHAQKSDDSLHNNSSTYSFTSNFKLVNKSKKTNRNKNYIKRNQYSLQLQNEIKSKFESMMEQQNKLHKNFIINQTKRYANDLIKEKERFLMIEQQRNQERHRKYEMLKKFLLLIANKHGIEINLNENKRNIEK